MSPRPTEGRGGVRSRPEWLPLLALAAGSPLRSVRGDTGKCSGSTREEPETCIRRRGGFETRPYIDSYNERRLHLALGYLSSNRYEEEQPRTPVKTAA